MSKRNVVEVGHPTVSPDRMIKHLKFNLHDLPSKGREAQPIMMWGQPGVGKSQIVQQVGVMTGRPVIDIRLLLKDPTDLSGIPYFNPETKRMEYAEPSELPHPEGKFAHAIILLDELSSAAPAVQAAALQLVLDRKVGTYTLPEGVSIVAAGNRSEDKSVHFSMPTPLRNRFAHFNIEVDFKSWERWAIQNMIHPVVVGYLKDQQSKLNNFDPAKKNVYAFATPRTWEKVSNVLWGLSDDKGRVKNDKDTHNLLMEQVNSLVGEAIGIEFMSSFELIGKLPDAMDILEGKVKEFDMQSVKNSAAYSLIVNLCHRMYEESRELKKQEAGVHADTMAKFGNNYLNFLMHNLDHQEDFIIMGASIALSQYELDISECEKVDELLEKYDNILTMI